MLLTTKNELFKFITCLSLGLAMLPSVEACTRAVYVGPQNTVLTGRSMDWVVTAGTNLWAFQSGMKRNGAAGTNSFEWQSKYSSIVASFFDGATVDGINEKGLVANVLYLAESKYPDPKTQGNRKSISIAAWAQYVLDSFTTVNEVVTALSKEPFYVMQVMTPDGHPGTGHLSVSDPSGDSAIIEYVDGKLVIHHDAKYKVMTNSPTFDQQLAINAYWLEIGGQALLPGTSRAADRFVRASYFDSILPQTADQVMSVAGILSVIRNASAPFGVAAADQPNISTTLWRSVADQKNLIYYFESTTSPNIFWIEFKDLKFAQGQPSMTLKVNAGQVYAGNTASKFVATAPFAFINAGS